jgi:hypothetical protein
MTLLKCSQKNHFPGVLFLRTWRQRYYVNITLNVQNWVSPCWYLTSSCEILDVQYTPPFPYFSFPCPCWMVVSLQDITKCTVFSFCFAVVIRKAISDRYCDRTKRKKVIGTRPSPLMKTIKSWESAHYFSSPSLTSTSSHHGHTLMHKDDDRLNR